MSRLTTLGAPGAPDAARVAPHAYRRLGGRILLTDDLGRWDLLREEEYRRYLAGLEETDPLFARLRAKGFLRHAYDFEEAAARLAERGLPAWKGPSSHVLYLGRGKRRMDLDTVKRCVDFAFTAPGPQLTLELCAEDASAAWPSVWFAVQYARRRSEWSRRPLFLVVRSRGGLKSEAVEFLRGHGVTRRLSFTLSGSPPKTAPAFPAQLARAVVTLGARAPEAWADWLRAGGVESVALDPCLELLAKPGGVAAYLEFYEAFLDRLLSMEGDAPREEWAAGLLERMTWNLPGADILEALAYDEEGGIHASELGLALGEAGLGSFALGRAGALRYQDLAQSELVRACLTAAQPDNQPLCSQCAYRAFCALPASSGHALQGSLWGQLPSSPLCRLRMGLLDLLFSRLDPELTPSDGPCYTALCPPRRENP